MTVISQVL